MYQSAFLNYPQIFRSFDEGLKIRDIFLVISKAFDEVWYERLIFEHRKNGIFGNLLTVLTDFLSNMKQMVVLNEQHLTEQKLVPWSTLVFNLNQ